MKSSVQSKYDKIASYYDVWDAVPERFYYHAWRRQLWSKVTAGKILEIGVGTGKNMHFYPPGAQVTGVDFSSGMLEKAALRAADRRDVNIELVQVDVNNLPFEVAQFDAVVGSFILMVVPDPLKTLQEVKRICKPGGKLLLLEFNRSRNRVKAFFQKLFTYLTRAVYCAHINRDIVGLVERSGFQIIRVDEMAGDVAKIIEASYSYQEQ